MAVMFTHTAPWPHMSMRTLDRLLPQVAGIPYSVDSRVKSSKGSSDPVPSTTRLQPAQMAEKLMRQLAVQKVGGCCL